MEHEQARRQSLRTLLVTNDFPPQMGGIQSYLFELVSSLPPEGVRILAPAYPGSEGFDSRQPFEVHREPTSRLYPGPRLLRRIRDLSRGMDVVQFGFALQSWLTAPAIKRGTGIPYVVFVHGAEVLPYLRIPGAARLLTWGSLGGAAEVMAVSDHTATGIKRLTGGRVSCTVLRPAIDLDKFHPSLQSGAAVRSLYGLGGEPVILCVSRLTARKGQDRLIDTMPELRRRFGARLLLVGEGGLSEKLRRRVRDRSLQRDVIFVGKAPDEELPAYYAAADLFAVPVRSRLFGLEEEGFGVVFAEAAASGLPMVVGDSGGAPEAVEDGVTGYLVDGRSRARIRDSLARLLADRALREKMGGAARARAASVHGAIIEEQYLDILRKAAAGATAGGSS